jgi:hypothetical protein
MTELFLGKKVAPCTPENTVDFYATFIDMKSFVLVNEDTLSTQGVKYMIISGLFPPR